MKKWEEEGGKRERGSERGRKGRERRGRARLGYLSRDPESLVTPLRGAEHCDEAFLCVCVSVREHTVSPELRVQYSPNCFYRYASAVLAMGLCLCLCLSVCLFVCPSVTSRCSTETAKRRITQTTPHDTPGILVF